MNDGCKDCARLLRLVNSETKFCVTEKGVLYLVDGDWYKENNCDEKVKEFYLKSKEPK